MDLEHIVRAFAEGCPVGEEGDAGPIRCEYCNGGDQKFPGYDGPLEVPERERRDHWDFVHADDCAWMAACHWVEENPDYELGRSLGCPECDADYPHECLFREAAKLRDAYGQFTLERLRAQVAVGEEPSILPRNVWFERHYVSHA